MLLLSRFGSRIKTAIRELNWNSHSTAIYGPTPPAAPRIVWYLKFFSVLRFISAFTPICWLRTTWHYDLSNTGWSSKNFLTSKNRLPTSSPPSSSMGHCGWQIKFDMTQHDPSYHEFEIHRQQHHHQQCIDHPFVRGHVIRGVHHLQLLPSSSLSKFGFIFFW